MAHIETSDIPSAVPELAGKPKQEKPKVVHVSSNGTTFCDYKNAEDLRRFMSTNGRLQSRRRTQLSARDQRLAIQAIKRARFMALLPYTDATL